MKKKVSGRVIGFDMDGVIIDNTENKIRLAKKFGFDLKPEDTAADRIEQVIPESILREMRPLLYDNETTALDASLIDGAKEGLRAIKASGCPYFLISRRRNAVLATKLLQRHGIWPDIFNDSNAFFVYYPEEKNEHAVRLGITRYVDDQPSVLEKLVNVPEKFLFDRFRQFAELPFKHTKIHSWDELLAKIL